jgi:hypothetical protein
MVLGGRLDRLRRIGDIFGSPDPMHSGFLDLLVRNARDLFRAGQDGYSQAKKFSFSLSELYSNIL